MKAMTWMHVVPALAGVLFATGASAAPVVVKDPSAINVCERVPGADVAKVLGRTLKSERPMIDKESKLSRCVYVLTTPARPEASEGLVLWLYAPKEYAELNSVTDAPLEKLAGLGDEAVRFRDKGDGRHKLRVLRRDRYSIEATGADGATAQALAKLAVERLDR